LERLADLNREIIAFCRESLDIRTPVVRSSELQHRRRKSDMGAKPLQSGRR